MEWTPVEWTPVDLETIAGILDDLSVNADADHVPGRILDMLFVQVTPDNFDPDGPSIDANAARVLAGLLRLAVPVADPALALTACLQYPLPDPTHGG